MLSRTAGNLYWLGRYIERAENVARILEVGYRMSIMSRDEETERSEWHSTVVISGIKEGFYAKHDEANRDNVIDYLVLDPENPSSLWSCLQTARTNARSVRTAMTTDMWESMNDTWLALSKGDKRNLLDSGDVRPFVDWVKERTSLFRGALLGTMLRDEAFDFANIGTFIERADNTARILDVKYHVLLPEGEQVGGALDYYQWIALLRAVSANRSYHWAYRDQLRPWTVAEFLILREEMPRSLVYCLSRIKTHLNNLADLHGQKHECQRMVGALSSRLKYARMDDIFKLGLHEYLTGFIDENVALSDEIAQTYLN